MTVLESIVDELLHAARLRGHGNRTPKGLSESDKIETLVTDWQDLQEVAAAAREVAKHDAGSLIGQETLVKLQEKLAILDTGRLERGLG